MIDFCGHISQSLLKSVIDLHDLIKYNFGLAFILKRMNKQLSILTLPHRCHVYSH